MQNYEKLIIAKEDEVYNQIYQRLHKYEDKNFVIKRSPQIGKYTPDFVVQGPNGYLAVIEVKYSLGNSSVNDNACNIVQKCMELLDVPYGYVTDGQNTIFLTSTGNKSKLKELYPHIDELLKTNIQKKDIGISEEQFEDIIHNFTAVIDEFNEKLYISYLKSFISHLRIKDYVLNESSISFSEEKERQFMRYLLGHYNKDSLCRYTSMSGLFRTLNTKKHSMVCLVGMNDKGETDYVQNYAKYNGFSNYTTTPINKLNDLFILSCCDEQKEDDLTMFRLYGDDSKGVCLKYGIKKIDSNKDFFIAPVSYAKNDGTHPKLDFFLAVSQIIHIRHLDAWLHFFKSFDYQVENEVRILYERKNKKKKWVNISSYGIICPVVEFDDNEFPITLDKIILGSNCPEKDVNRDQIETMAQEDNIVIKYGVSLSKKNSYRVSY